MQRRGAMPPERGALADGAAALGVAPTGAQLDTLTAYLDLLAKWNRVYNLTAVRDRSQMVVQHVLDSASVVAPVQRWSRGQPRRVLDVGSGAGLPGVVIAVLLPSLDVTCVDAVGKKASFVRQVAAELDIRNLHATHARAESLSAPPFDLVISRAFADLATFTALTRGALAHGGAWLAMKGKVPADEIAALPAEVEMFHVEQVSVPGLDADRCLVWMRERSRVDDAPRAPPAAQRPAPTGT